ncbi:MAG TPA: glycosyltransferase [Ilumatobacter sp.]|nr:glycosyltransferase [Ilumatobacter sp.]
MADPIRFSVVIPAYQAEATVRTSVESALDQVPPPAEVIVVDDGSTDGTAAVLAEFGDRIRVITQPNGGEASARNTGLAAATCEWIAYLDADDWFLPGRLAAISELIIERPTLDLVTTDELLVSEGDIIARGYSDQWTFAHSDQRREILRRNFVIHGVVRAAALRAVGGFEESIDRATDWAAWIKLILAGGQVGAVARPLACYRMLPTSLSADRLGMARGGLRALRVAEARPELSDAEREVLVASIRGQESLIHREELSLALERGTDDRRRRARAVLLDSGSPPGARAKAAAVVVAPSLAGWMQRRRSRGTHVGTAGRPVARDQRTPSPADTTALVTVLIEPSGDDHAAVGDTLASLRAQTLPTFEITGAPELSAVRTPTLAVVPAGTMFDPGAVERRLLAFTSHYQAGAVVDLGPGTDDLEVVPSGRLNEALARRRAALPTPTDVLYRTSALRDNKLSELTVGTDQAMLDEIANLYPVVLIGGPDARPQRAAGRVGIYLDSPIIGGAERSALHLVERYSGAIELVVCATSRAVLDEVARVAPVVERVLLEAPHSLRDDVRRYRRTLGALDLDVLQLTLGNPFAGRTAALAARSLGIAVVAAEHLVFPARRRRGRVATRLFGLAVDAYVTVGRATADDLHRWFGIPRRKIHVIHNGLPDVAVDPYPYDRRPTIGCAARLEDQKQLDVLVSAIAALPDVHLALVGDGTRRADLERLAIELGIADRIEFVGWVPDARPHIAGLDMFVLPSAREAFPLTIVEAMLAGVPVVASDVGSVAEAVRHDETGLLVPAGSVDDLIDAIRRLLDDDGLRRRLASAGQAFARRELTVQTMVSRYEQLWLDLL